MKTKPVTRLAEVKAERDKARSELNLYWLVLSDLMTGHPKRGGAPIKVSVEPWGKDDGATLRAVIHRPLGAWPIVAIVDGDSVHVVALSEWPTRPSPYRTRMNILAERVRVAVDRAVRADEEAIR